MRRWGSLEITVDHHEGRGEDSTGNSGSFNGALSTLTEERDPRRHRKRFSPTVLLDVHGREGWELVGMTVLDEAVVSYVLKRLDGQVDWGEAPTLWGEPLNEGNVEEAVDSEEPREEE